MNFLILKKQKKRSNVQPLTNRVLTIYTLNKEYGKQRICIRYNIALLS